jgi:two-component system LytT family sensor kinase
MKTTCERCAVALEPDGEAYICAYECTFCSACASHSQNVCPHCGGELVRRPRQRISIEPRREQEIHTQGRHGLIWVVSFLVFSALSLIATATLYQLYRTQNPGTRLGAVAAMEFSQILTFAPLTPFAFAFAVRYSFRRGNWLRRSLLHLVAGFLFTLGHITLRSATPYGYYDARNREWSSAFWDSHAHSFRPLWFVFKRQFLSSVVDDVTGVYIPIVLIAHALSYYRRYRERELRAAQLEGQLAKAHLQSLKGQLQPHFLFNTLHSISALMLTDVSAADRVMSRLSDLLRISLDNVGTQITTLRRELEFVNCYLEIEKVRFEERMKVTLDIAPETLDAQVPHLLLQPLVDNAVKHGISKLLEGGEIRISVHRHDDKLQFEVKDNGPGLGTQAMLPTNGLGLSITRQRLESLYGQEQSLELISPPKGGVTIRVCIPFRVQPGNDSAAWAGS